MTQQIIVYILFALAIAYLSYRIYGSVKKKQACNKCELMKATKKSNSVG